MTLPAVTCEWPSRTLCRPIARDTWTPLGLSPSPPPRGHPKGILDLASIANRRKSAHVVPSCYDHSTVDLRTNVKNDSLFFVWYFRYDMAYLKYHKAQPFVFISHFIHNRDILQIDNHILIWNSHILSYININSCNRIKYINSNSYSGSTFFNY